MDKDFEDFCRFTLAGRIDKVRNVFSEYGEDNFYISYSGGKDSNVVDKLIDIAVPDNNIPRVFIRTGIELNAVTDFVIERAKVDPRVHIISPQVNIRKTLDQNGYPFKSKIHARKFATFWRNGMTDGVNNYVNAPPENTHFSCPKSLRYQFTQEFLNSTPLRFSAWCCYEMKEKPLLAYSKQNGFKYFITGIRKAEGGSRSNTNCLSFRKDELWSFNPLAPLIDEFMDWMIEKYDIKLPIVYYPPYNFPRTGCKGCPFALNLQHELDVLEEFFPNERKQCEILWKPVYDEYRRIGYRLRPLDEGHQMSIEEFIKGDINNE